MLHYSDDLNETVTEAISVRLELEDIMKEAIEISQAIVNDFEEKFSPVAAKETPLPFEPLVVPQYRSIPEEVQAVEVAVPIEQVQTTEEIKALEEPTEIEALQVFEERIEMEARQELEDRVDLEDHNEIPEKPEAAANVEKIRIYELAREFDMPSKELLNLIKGLGIDVNNHMNMLDEEQALSVRQALLAGEEKRQEDQVNSAAAPDREQVSKDLPSGSLVNMLVGDQEDQEEALDYKNIITKEEPVLNSEEPVLNNQEPVLKSEEPVLENEEPVRQTEKSELGFSIEELKAAHPYIAVRTLHEKGYSVREIAKLLNRGQGEVSLILNLSKKKQAVI